MHKGLCSLADGTKSDKCYDSQTMFIMILVIIVAYHCNALSISTPLPLAREGLLQSEMGNDVSENPAAFYTLTQRAFPELVSALAQMGSLVTNFAGC